MDSGKAFDKPMPSVDVLKKFQVECSISSGLSPPPGSLRPLARIPALPASISVDASVLWSAGEAGMVPKAAGGDWVQLPHWQVSASTAAHKSITH